MPAMRCIHPPQRQRRCCGGRVVKTFRRPPTGRLRDRNGGLPRLADGVAHPSRCPASPRRPRVPFLHRPWAVATRFSPKRSRRPPAANSGTSRAARSTPVWPPETIFRGKALYQGALIMAHRDRVGGSSGRRKGAGDAAHPPSAAAAPRLRRTGRQNFPTPSDGPHTRPQRRLTKAFGRCRARFAMPRIATAHAPGRKPW